METGELIKIVDRNLGVVQYISHDGQILVSVGHGNASDCNTIYILDLETEELLQTIEDFEESCIHSAAISPDRQTVVSEGIKIWNLKTGQLLRTLDSHEDYDDFFFNPISPDEQILISTSPISIWNLKTGQLLQTVPNTWEDKSLAISPNGRTVVSGSDIIKIWHIELGKIKLISTLPGHSPVAISPDGRTLVSGGNNKTIKIWNLQKGEPLHTLTGDNVDEWLSLAISPDGRTLASANGHFSDSDNTIKIWDLETGQFKFNIPKHSYSGSDEVLFALNPNGKTVVSGVLVNRNSDKNIVIWNLETGEPVKTLTMTDDRVHSLAISPDGQTLVSGGRENINIWNLKTGEVVETLKGHEQEVDLLSISNNGRILASSGSSDKTINIWNLRTGKLINTLSVDVRIDSLAISPDGRILVIGSGEYRSPGNTFILTIKIYNLETGELLKTLTGHKNGVYSLAISPDGQTLVSGSRDSTIKIWNLETGELLHTLTGHEDSVSSLAISPDGLTLVSGNDRRWDNATIKMWNLKTGELIKTISEPNYDVNFLSFSGDGKTLVSGGSGEIRIWRLER